MAKHAYVWSGINSSPTILVEPPALFGIRLIDNLGLFYRHHQCYTLKNKKDTKKFR